MKRCGRMKRCSGGGSDLPQEILHYILLLLPAKSLMRFRSVSKLWLSIISDPQFISSFFKSARPKLLLSVPQSLRYRLKSGQFIFSLDYECCRRPLSLTVASHGLVPYLSVPKAEFSQSLAGLVFIQYGFTCVVCNPSTREYVLLPYPLIRSPNTTYINHFGFDPVENTYKILSTMQYEGGPNVFVTTLGGNDRWRVLRGGYVTSYLVNEEFSSQVVQRNGAGVCIKGIIYYLSMQNRILVGFDVRLETFKVIPLPADVVGLSNSFLMEWNDGCVSVALVNYRMDYDEIPVYTLVLKEDDQVWICERFAMPDELRRKLIQGGVTLVGTTHKGELLYATSIDNSSGESNLYVWNLKDASLKKIEVDGLPKDQIYPPGIHHLRVCNYVENLMSLKSLGYGHHRVSPY